MTTEAQDKEQLFNISVYYLMMKDQISNQQKTVDLINTEYNLMKGNFLYFDSVMSDFQNRITQLNNEVQKIKEKCPDLCDENNVQ